MTLVLGLDKIVSTFQGLIGSVDIQGPGVFLGELSSLTGAIPVATSTNTSKPYAF